MRSSAPLYVWKQVFAKLAYTVNSLGSSQAPSCNPRTPPPPTAAARGGGGAQHYHTTMADAAAGLGGRGRGMSLAPPSSTPQQQQQQHQFSSGAVPLQPDVDDVLLAPSPAAGTEATAGQL
ncbi:hypothetical protein STCU_11236 [Strigomonas culicis]|uniref:Uncharacterized protein n=1 Tax=Strigomonas culicis TaxID=28005 RepID=S9TEI7_9TRYP|nr:hypothetical protein STCU_11236 [Strigomonas culicis]|eukprot:EPY16467.1 hypothetical protein STCU_11236 [Strigomonas culicis]